jgi:DNA-directed RNA polymerase specialized sigma24 family protein
MSPLMVDVRPPVLHRTYTHGPSCSAVRRWIYGHRDYIEGVLRRYSDSADVASDLVQETFFQVLRSLPHFRGGSKLTT